MHEPPLGPRRGDRLAGQVAVVTGGGSAGDFLGTGAATSILFAAQGAHVVIVDVSAERAASTIAMIEAEGATAVSVVADITDDDAAAAAVRATIERFGQLDVLVNNAAIVVPGDVTTVSAADWDRAFDVNVKGTMHMSRHALPAMVDNGGGSVVNVSSITAVRGIGTAAYAATKGALLALTNDMAFSHGPSGVRVNCLVPGHIDTPMGDPGDDEVSRSARRRAGVLDSRGTAWDFAYAALFLASAEARWITGVQLPVDAGAMAAAGLGAIRLRK